MQNAVPPLLDERSLDALRRTRPWLYFLGILSGLLSALALILLLAGSIGLHTDQLKAISLIGAGVGILLISAPAAITQLGYATALSRVAESTPEDLPDAVALACVRQRNLWVVNAFTVGLLAVITVIQLVSSASLL